MSTAQINNGIALCPLPGAFGAMQYTFFKPLEIDACSRQYALIRLDGYRSAARGLDRDQNPHTPVRPGASDEHAWFSGFDLAVKDGVATA